MKKIIFCFALIYLGNTINAQSYLFNPHLDWSKYEMGYQNEYKKNEIEKINDDLMVYLKGSGLLISNISNFHFFDYDFNGSIDIIYSGYAGTDTKRTLIFELTNDGNYNKTFDKFGELISIYPINSFLPYTLILKEEACCGGVSIVYEIYQPLKNNGKIELHLSAKYSSIIGMSSPYSFFDKPILFEVKKEMYYLRLSPIINNETFDEELHINGNILAEYTAGAKGYAISEEQDRTGRSWWFVIMLNNNKPLKSIFDVGSNNENEFYSVGWMSSRYLEKIE